MVGKTNEDEDRATIANITGNGNNLVLSNFGFAEGSGYGLYKQNFSKTQWMSPSARVEVTKTNSSFNITEVKKITIPTGIHIYIHEVGGNFTELQNIKSLKAICSNGIVYDENWNPISVKVGSLEEYSNKLLLGYLSNSFTQIAFKNMSIYSNQLLSKEDCIKAYNYLQTLKAK